MALKPLNKWASSKQSDADKANNHDRDASGDFCCDGFTDSGDPNGMGPTMRPLYDATAGAFTSPARGGFNGADQHNDHYPQPLPRSQNSKEYGVAKATTGGDDGRVTAKWPKS